MVKKVLIISSSPRKGGNSEILCDEFLRGANEAKHDVEKISLRNKEIGHCLACGSCSRNNGICVRKDDMEEVLDKMICADVIVMATPVYFYAMTGQMKTLIDRTYAKYTQIKNKDMYFIITAADPNKQAINRTIEEFRGFTDCLSGVKEKGIVNGTGAWDRGDIKCSKAIDQAYLMGLNL